MRKLLNEAAEYKFSKKLHDEVVRLWATSVKNNHTGFLYHKIRDPNEVIYHTPKILIGFSLYILSDYAGLDNQYMDNFFDKSDPPRSFVKSAQSIINGARNTIEFTFSSNMNNFNTPPGVRGVCALSVGNRVGLGIDWKLSKEPKVVAFNVIRHELQHLTGMYNGISIIYYNRLKKVNFDLLKLQTLSMKDLDERETAFVMEKISRSKVRMSDLQTKKAIEDPSLSQQGRNYRRYVLEPSEYRTHLSDMITRLLYLTFVSDDLYPVDMQRMFALQFYKAIKQDKEEQNKGNDIQKKLVKDLIDRMVKLYDTNDNFKDLYQDSFQPSFKHYMEIPKMREQMVRDFKRYVPGRIVAMYDGILQGSSYKDIPQDRVQEFAESMHDRIATYLTNTTSYEE